MSFLSLPLEIHQRIISRLLSNRNVAALSIQCRTLHTMCDMKTRQRYHRISVSSSEESVDNAFEFLMDILRRPSLGQYVRHVECVKPTTRHMDYKEVEYERDLSSEDMGLVRKAVNQGGFHGPKEDRIVNMLMRRMDKTSGGFRYRERETIGTYVSQALAAILIVVSPNIVSMAITHPSSAWCDSEMDFPLAELLGRVNASPEDTPYLRHLRDVYVINKSDSTWLDNRFFLPMNFYSCMGLFENLPSIESIRTDIMEDDPDLNFRAKDKSSNISRISIHHSSVESTYLARVIWSCKILKEFQYSIGGRSSEDGGHCIFNPKTFIKAICRHKKTLEVLDVDVESQLDISDIGDEEHREESLNKHGSPFEASGDNETITFLELVWKQTGSLKEFVALKRLSLGINFLLYFAGGVDQNPNARKPKMMLADCLPENLEYLCVRGYQKGENPKHDEQMNALMAFYESGSSQLKEVKGFEELIPHAEDVKDPDGDDHLLWSLEELGYESD